MSAVWPPMYDPFLLMIFAGHHGRAVYAAPSPFSYVIGMNMLNLVK